MLEQKTETFDLMGILFSSACVIHCLFFPVLSAALPSVSVFFENEWIHIALILSLMPVAFIAFTRGKKKHGKTYPLVIGLLGVLLLLTAVASESFEIEGLEKVLTLIGSIALIGAHVLNLKAPRKS